MTNTTITSFRKNVFEYVDTAIRYNDVINVATKSGNAVVISEDEYNSLKETVYLMSIPGLVEGIQEARKAPDEEFTELKDVDWT